jgi:hypothetical protein
MIQAKKLATETRKLFAKKFPESKFGPVLPTIEESVIGSSNYYQTGPYCFSDRLTDLYYQRFGFIQPAPSVRDWPYQFPSGNNFTTYQEVPGGRYVRNLLPFDSTHMNLDTLYYLSELAAPFPFIFIGYRFQVI